MIDPRDIFGDGRAVLYQADVLDGLRSLPAESVHCCVTSPPYWGLRSYGVEGQLGLEKTPEKYVSKMVEVFREVRRVLREDGTLWLNLGDSYASGKGTCRNPGGGPKSYIQEKERFPLDRGNKSTLTSAGLKPKDLVGIPWRVAFALQADGWYLRQDIIWAKPNPMPESVTDRCTKAHEYVFLLTKSARYFYDAFAVSELYADAVKEYNGTNENFDLFRTCDAPLAGQEQGTKPRDPTAIPERSSRTKGAHRIPKDRRDEECAGKVAGVAFGPSIHQEIPEKRQSQGRPSEILQDGQVSGADEAVSTVSQGGGILAAEHSQEKGAPTIGGLRLDGGTMGCHQVQTESSLCDLPETRGVDARPHHSSGEGRPTYGQQHSSPVPELQQPEKRRLTNIVGNMSERGVTRTTEGLNLKTAAEKRSPTHRRNLRSVWTFPTQAFKEAHFATFPLALPLRCIKAGTSEKGCCPTCGKAWERMFSKEYNQLRKRGDWCNRLEEKEGSGYSRSSSMAKYGIASVASKTVGFRPGCSCGGDPVPCVVLDPFAGVSTTGVAALQPRIRQDERGAAQGRRRACNVPHRPCGRRAAV